MHHLTLITLVALTGSGCAMVGVGPVVDHDFCARGHIDEEFVLRDLRSRAPKELTFNGLVFNTPQAAPRAASGRAEPAPASGRVQEVEAKIDLSAPVVLFSTGPSRVLPMSLPRDEQAPRSLAVAPQRSGLTLSGKLDCTKSPTGASAFRLIDPMVTFLDDSLRPLPGMSEGEPTTHGVQGAKRFLVPPGAKHFLVHYDSSKLGQRFVLLGKDYTVLLPASGIFVPTPASGTVRGIRTSTGAFTVAFER